MEISVSKGKILVIGSNATGIEVQGGGIGATGQYLNETVVPVLALIDAGYDVVLATPSGAKPHIDPASDSAQHFEGDEAAYQRARAFFDNAPSMNGGRTLRSVVEEGLDNYAGVFISSDRVCPDCRAGTCVCLGLSSLSDCCDPLPLFTSRSNRFGQLPIRWESRCFRK